MLRPLVLAAMAMLAGAQPAAPSVTSTLPDSVALLYSQLPDGSLDFRCSSTAFKSPNTTFQPKPGKRFFLTAAHCITEKTSGGLRPLKQKLFLSSDQEDEKVFVLAEALFTGSENDGFDFAILEAKLVLPEVEIGSERKHTAGDRIVNVASPLGIGKVLLYGHISAIKVDRPLVDREQNINWAGIMGLQIAGAPGSSGSAIVSADTGKIIGVLVGGYGIVTLAMPISRFLEVLEHAPVRQ